MPTLLASTFRSTFLHFWVLPSNKLYLTRGPFYIFPPFPASRCSLPEIIIPSGDDVLRFCSNLTPMHMREVSGPYQG